MKKFFEVIGWGVGLVILIACFKVGEWTGNASPAAGVFFPLAGFIAGIVVGSYCYRRLCQLLPPKPNPLDQEMAEIRAQHKAEQEAWRQKIAYARRLLTGVDWRDPAGKQKFVDEVYEGKIPEYLWYALGDRRPSESESKAIVEFFWDGLPRLGDFELHGSHNLGVGNALRIRHPRRFATEITVGVTPCPLYMTGYSDMFGNAEGEPAALFLNLYEEPVASGPQK
jgi:hypothetical protein